MMIDKSREKPKALGHGQCAHINWFDGGGAEVHKLWDQFVLFEIPQYGGEGRYTATYHESDMEKLLEEVEKWT